MPTLTVLPDDSVLASGDQTKSDTYRISLATAMPKVTACRVEALPDDRLPRRGPGRIAYEGPFGDFFLSEVAVRVGQQKLALSAANHSFANGGNTAAAAIDGDPQTGWSIDGGQGRAHTAVFTLAQPLADASTIDLDLLFERYYSAGLGRFRVWATDDPRPPIAQSLPSDVEALLLVSEADRTPAERARLMAHFLSIAPELASERAGGRQTSRAVASLSHDTRDDRASAGEPAAPRTSTSGANSCKPPTRSNRGCPACSGRVRTARATGWRSPGFWSARNPLVGRVTVNRHWAALFGRGIVRTTEDFGYQGEPPTHAELLDWMAVEFVRQRLVGQTTPSAARDQRHISPIVASDQGALGKRSAKQAARPRPRACGWMLN